VILDYKIVRMSLPPVQSLEPIRTQIKSGNESFHFSGEAAGFDLRLFWQWSVSDLVSNATRGRLAEFIVARALGADGAVRSEWDAYDLKTPSGIKVEVKSAAYVQSWFQKRLSTISFLCGATRGWTAETNLQTTESSRWADVYVFALLHHQIKETIDPLDLEQWEFYVVGTDDLNRRTRSQHSITLASLKARYAPVKYAALAEAVERAAVPDSQMKESGTD
jgi:hypothetical protein